MKVKVATYNTVTHWGPEEKKNLDLAVGYIAEAAAAGAQLICFPEGYPGPCHGELEVTAADGREFVEVMRDEAKRNNVYVSFGNVEPADVDGAFYLTHKFMSPEGKLLANYRRVQPDHPQLNSWLMNGRRHILPGNEIPTIDTDLGRIGLMICSELWVPEISRIHMLQGAQILIAPVSGAPTGSHYRLKDTWHAIARARAAENQLYVLIAENSFVRPEGDSKLGVACIAGPEEMLATAGATPGPMYAELDLDRQNWLRTRYVETDLLTPPATEDFVPIGVRTGQIHDRRPEMYSKLVQPQADAFRYEYFKDGLDSVDDEYVRVRNNTAPVLNG